MHVISADTTVADTIHPVSVPIRYRSDNRPFSSQYPTHHGDSTSSIVDLVLSSYPSSSDKVNIGREFSDHCLVLFHVLLVPAATQSRTRKIFLYSKGDYDQLRATLMIFVALFSTPQRKLTQLMQTGTTLRKLSPPPSMSAYHPN